MKDTNPLERFYFWEKQTPDQVLFRQPLPDKSIDYTYRTAGEQIRKIAKALLGLNLPPNSKVSILSKNCAHWMMADFAIWMAGHVSVPLYPTLTTHSIRQILDHCEAKAIFVGKLDDYENQRTGIPEQVQKISFPFFGINEGTLWDDMLRDNQPLEGFPNRPADELATIKYTSGTTGIPKGVMISFGAFDFALSHAIKEFQFELSKERFFSYLPLSHIAERMLVELGAIYTGSAIYFSESLEKFPVNLMEAQPTIFLAVPRIWAKFREKIQEKMPPKKLDRLLSIPIVRGIVKNAIRKKLGLSKAKWILTGASPISKELLEWYSKLGIIIHEVYGMTENLAYSHINLQEVKFGTVGKAWTNIQARISEEGEIQTKHVGTMMGYYKEPQQTAELFTPDGWLKTGDKGEVDADGFLTITGRIKDLFKTDKGKYIAPTPIELKLSSNPDMEQVCVVGMGVPQPMALVVLSAAGKTKSKEEIIKSLSATLALVNSELESYEKLEAAVIMKSDWTIENGLITPSMKIKRSEVEKIHLPKYPMWFNMKQPVVWET